MKFKKKIYIFKGKGEIAITKAYSKEEAVHIFEKQYHNIVASWVQELEFNPYGIAEIK